MHLLTRLALNKIPIIIMLAVLIIGGGVVSATALKSELLPNIDLPLVSIVTIYPGASPDDVQRDVSEPVEKALAGTANLKTITSRSNDSVSFVTAEYEYGTDMDKTQRTIQDAVNKITFPTQAQRPTVGRFSFNDIPVLSYSLNTSSADPEALYNLKQQVNQNLVPDLEAIPGVNSVTVAGGGERDVLITLDDAKLAANGLTAAAVTGVLQANNISFPAGEIIDNNQSIPVRITHQFESLDDLKKIIVGYKMPAGAGVPGTTAGGAPGAVPGAAPGGAAGSTQIQAPGTTISNTTTTSSTTTTGTTTSRTTGAQAGATRTATSGAGATAKGAGAAATPARTQTGATTTSGQPAAVPTPPATTQAPPAAPKPVTLGDVAAVELANVQSDSISRTNGKPSLSVIVYKTQNGNTVQVADAVNAKFADLAAKIPNTEAVLDFDSSVFIKDSLNGLIREGVLGAVLAIFVILLFLASVRSTLVTALSIPMSILIAFILLNFFNISLNIMSLAGLAVAVGRVVDDSIVVLENIYRHHFQNRESIRDAAFNGTREVATAITASTLTTVSVFLPLGFIAGLVSVFFQPFAIAVSVALLASLLVALTLIPVLAALLLGTNLATYKGEKHQKDTLVQRAYTPVIRLALRNRWTKLGTLALAILLFIGSLTPVFTGGIGLSFLSIGSDKVISATVKMKPGTDIHTTDVTAQQAEQVMLKDPTGMVQTIQTTIGANTGAAATGFSALGSNSTIQWSITLKPEANLDQEAEWIRGQVKTIPNADDYSVTTGTGAGPNSSGYSVVVSGNNYDDVLKTAQTLTDKLKAIPDLVNVTNDAATAKPEIHVLVDPDKALQHGTTAIQVAGQLRNLLTQQKVTTITINGQGYDVLATYDPATFNSLDKIKAIQVGTVNPVPLGDIATVDTVNGPVSITRINQERAVTVQGTITAKSTTGVSADAQKAINTLIDATTGRNAAGTKIAVTGVLLQQSEAFGQLGFAILISIALVYIIMVTTFGSLSTPFVILFSLPLAAIGSLVALWVTGQPLGISAMIGVLMLVGIVVTNAIVLLDLVEQMKHRGMPTDEALVQGGRTRVRPILMTAIATIIALIPLAAGGDQGSLIAAELGIVVIGGLFTSTLLTLIVVPVVYSLLDGVRQRFTRTPAAVDTAAPAEDEPAVEVPHNGHVEEPVPPRIPVGTGA